MRRRLFVFAILVVASALTFSQTPKPKAHSTITGCLTSTGHPNEYQLVDEKGITNQVYSTTVHLDSYVGHLSPSLETKPQRRALIVGWDDRRLTSRS
jgi:hypothetical protein